jgi:hypothetical protein
MERHRHDQVAFLDEPRAGAREPKGKARHQLQPVGMFQGQDGRAAEAVIGHDGASPVISRRLGKTGGATRIRPQLDAERKAAAIAQRSVQKDDPAPASGAKARGACQRLTAGDAKRRKEKVHHRRGHRNSKSGFPIAPHPTNLDR